MAAFCFCCFLCCLLLCFALPRKPTIKALSWSQAWYLLLHHCLPVSGDQCYKPAAVLALLSCFLGRLKHLSLLCGRCFRLIAMTTQFLEHPYSTRCGLWTWSCFLVFLYGQPDGRGCDTEVCPEAADPWVATAGTPWLISSSARGPAGTPQSMGPGISPQESSYTPGGTAAMGKAMLEQVSSEGLWPWLSLCHSRYNPEETVAYR